MMEMIQFVRSSVVVSLMNGGGNIIISKMCFVWFNFQEEVSWSIYLSFH